MREAYLPDVKPDEKPDRILLVTQTYDMTPGASSVYEYFLSDETRAAKGKVKFSEYDRLRSRDLAATLARFPDYEVKPPSFAGDISLYRKQ